MSTRQTQKPKPKRQPKKKTAVKSKPMVRPRRRPNRPAVLKAKGIATVISKLGTFSDFPVKGNSFLRGGVPSRTILSATASGNTFIQHREYVADITATIAFTNRQYIINPGLPASFPWMATIAANYEQYRIWGMVFEFRSMSATAVLSTGANTALGTVIMATSYNEATADFIDKRTMENYAYANSSPPSRTFYHPIESARGQTPVTELYVRVGATPSAQDLRLYDLGVFNLATVGMQGNVGVIGELWVSFEVEFLKPKLISGPGLNLLGAKYSSSTYSNLAPLLGSTIVYDLIGLTVSSGLTIVFPQYIVDQSFYLYFSWHGSSTVTIASPLVTTTNGVLTTSWFNGVGQTNPAPLGSTINSIYTVAMIFQTTAPAPTISINAGGTLPNAGFLDWVCYQIPAFDQQLTSTPCRIPVHRRLADQLDELDSDEYEQFTETLEKYNLKLERQPKV